MRNLHCFWIGLLLGAWLASSPAAEMTFRLLDGEVITGEPVSFDERGVLFRLSDGRYADTRTPWSKFSQEDLKKLATNPRAKPHAEPFIEPDPQQRAAKTEVTIRPVDRLERPEPRGFLGAFFSTGVGLVTLLLLYLANLYAAYEISIFRARPAGLVCGVAAVAPVIGPLVFLSLPTKVELPPEEESLPPEQIPLPEAAPESGAAAPSGLSLAARPTAQAERPAPQVFPRGQYTFNRRFIETRFAGFFTIVRREAEKDLVLVIKAGRGQFVANRITRITASEMHVQVQKGAAVEEVSIPFTDIQEIVLKHKDD